MLSLKITSACKIKHTNTQTHTKKFPGEQPRKCPSVLSYQLIRTLSSVPTERKPQRAAVSIHGHLDPKMGTILLLPAWQL